MNVKKPKNTKKKVLVFLILILLGIGIGFTVYYTNKKKPEVPTNTVEVVDSIKNFAYHLDDRDTDIYKENFLKLKYTLEQEKIDYKEYAKLLAKLFLIDLYTIDNKVSKYDVGALDFIYESEQEKFKKKVIDTLYKLVEDNASNTRHQELPIVKDVEIDSLEETTYDKGNTKLNGYKVKANIIYEKDLNYDKEVEITIANEENKLYVVSLTPVL